MASNARIAYDKNKQDIYLLIDMYETAKVLFEADDKPVPEGYEVALRAGLVLLVTYWEAYIEDICDEALRFIINSVSDPDALPKELKKQVADELKSDKNELAVWSLAGEGWRDYVMNRLTNLKDARNRKFNSPKVSQTNEFVFRTLGIKDISSCWKFTTESNRKACEFLDAMIEERGTIAHRGKLNFKISAGTITKCSKFIDSIVGMTGGRINSHCKRVTGKDLWPKTTKKTAAKKTASKKSNKAKS